MANVVIIIVLLAIVAAAIMYMVKAKKRGVKCIGCPAGGKCAHKQSDASYCSCSCSSEAENRSEGCCGCHTDANN